MHLFSKEKYIKIDYYHISKILILLFKSGLHKNQLYIVYRLFIHLSSEERYIKINYNHELNIFLSHLRDGMYLNQFLL